MMYALFDPVNRTPIGFTIQLTQEITDNVLYKEIPEDKTDLEQWRWVGTFDHGEMMPNHYQPPDALEQLPAAKMVTFAELKVKDPSMKFRYINGLGDFIAWFLHSKGLGWLTHWITGQKFPCNGCNRRRQALNVLIPLPVWKGFFKTPLQRKESLVADYQKLGIVYRN